MRVRQRAGFTLVEVVVALAIAGVVLLAARQMLEALAAHEARLTAAARAADRVANADRLLRALVSSLEMGTPDTRQFEGAERAARFSSWCDTPAGWQERCRVVLAVDSAADRGAMLVLRITGASDDRIAAPWSRAVVVRRGFAAAELRYLGDAGQGGTWFETWGRSITAPLAIAVVLVRSADGGLMPNDSAAASAPARVDTLILRIGERG